MDPGQSKRILVRSPNWLGDAVIALPAIRTWQKYTHPASSFAVACPENLIEFWKHIPGIDATFIADRNPVITASNISSWKADTVFILPNSPRTALESYLAQIPCRIGFTGKWRSFLLTHSFDRPAQKGFPHHQSLDALDLLKSFKLIPEDALLTSPEIPHPERPQTLPGQYILICPGAEYGSAKRWPAERFAHLANHLGQSENLPIILSGADKDRETCSTVTEQLTVPFIDLAGQTSLSEFLSLCAHSKLTICNDSGAMHVAAMFKTPGIALFGSTEPRWTGPISDSVSVLQEDVPCSPCFLRDCPIDFRCMNQLSEEQVLESCLKQISAL